MTATIEEGLSRLKTARSRDESEDLLAELGELVKQQPNEAVDLYYKGCDDPFSLLWALQGSRGSRVFEAFEHGLSHKSQWVRWAAIEGLNRSKRKELIPVFLNALKDRSHFVKGTAVKWLRDNGDETAVEPLKHLASLKSLQKHAPGIVTDANRAIQKLTNA